MRMYVLTRLYQIWYCNRFTAEQETLHRCIQMVAMTSMTAARMYQTFKSRRFTGLSTLLARMPRDSGPLLDTFQPSSAANCSPSLLA